MPLSCYYHYYFYKIYACMSAYYNETLLVWILLVEVPNNILSQNDCLAIQKHTWDSISSLCFSISQLFVDLYAMCITYDNLTTTIILDLCLQKA